MVFVEVLWSQNRHELVIDIIIYDKDRFYSKTLGENKRKKQDIPVESFMLYIEAKHTLFLSDTGQSVLRHMNRCIR
jgi:hypothetical protein